MTPGTVARSQSGRARRSMAAAVFMIAIATASAAAQSVVRYRRAAAYSAAHEGDAVLVYRGGRLVYADYQNGWTAGRVHPLASGTKSFNCVIAALGQADGLFTLDTPVAQTITEWRTDPVKSRITIRQLLSLTAGLQPEPTNGDDFASAISLPMVGRPGAQFAYGATDFFVFGELMRRKLAGGDVVGYLARHVFRPLGIDTVYWLRDPLGNPQLAGGAALTATEWGRFGVLLLQHGTYDGKPLVPARALAACSRGSAANPSYGLGFWINADDAAPPAPRGVTRAGPKDRVLSAADLPHDIYLAAGSGGQRLYILPSAQLAVVRLGHNTGPDYRDATFLRILLGRSR